MITNRSKIKFTLTILFSILLLSTNVSGKAAAAKRVVIYGDSLSAAFGMDLEQGWATLLAESLAPNHTVINASISGDTSAAGLARLPLTLAEFKPDVLILELGANDGLRGLPIDSMKQNLENMIKLGQDSGAKVALVGISLPASYGPRYIDQFRKTYVDLAEQYNLPFIDFYREEFFLKPGYIQEDGLHPTAITQPLVRDIVIEFLNENSLLSDAE
ncbi:arylesterase [Arenicella xantha]|nr:arylesterase [Arenicella xantha]